MIPYPKSQIYYMLFQLQAESPDAELLSAVEEKKRTLYFATGLQPVSEKS